MSRSIAVIEPGLLTTVQDLGRPGLMRFGFTPGGAIDRGALILGNRLVGNLPSAAGLEVTLIGPRLRFHGEAMVAITGADLGASLNRESVPLWTPLLVRDGDELSFDPLRDTKTGARAYICIAGGIDIAPVMGSRSTDLFARFGGVEGRSLVADDRLPLGEPSESADQSLRRRLAVPPAVPLPDQPVRVVIGPQRQRFTDAGIATFFQASFSVSSQSDRMGMRLSGPPLALSHGADMISEGIAHGAIQVPGDGQPIVLLAGRQTVGGYPKIATVIGADLDRLGQRRPADRITFAEVDRPTAREAHLASLARLGDDAIVSDPAPGIGLPRANTGGLETPMIEREMGEISGWDATSVSRLVQSLHEANVVTFRLQIANLGVDLEWYRDADTGGEARRARAAEPVTSSVVPSPTPPDGAVVTAPMLGMFYRRPAPDQAPFVEEGHPVTNGQQIGLIEVMKTFHEITASRDGTLTEFHVEDGQFVEFGQTIATIADAA